MNLKERQLRAHFDAFIDRDARYPGYVLTDDAWRAFKKSETYGKRNMTPAEWDLAAPLFGAKWSYEITIQSLWQEIADNWSSNWGWGPPLFATIMDVYHGWEYDREGNRFKTLGNRVYLRALFKIRDSIREKGFVDALMSYTGLDMEAKRQYVDKWMAANPCISPM